MPFTDLILMKMQRSKEASSLLTLRNFKKYFLEKQEIEFNRIDAIAIQCTDGIIVILKEKIPFSKTLQLPLPSIQKNIPLNNLAKKIEGYWYSEYSPEYTMPVPNQLNEEEAGQIYLLIKIKEKEAKKLIARGMAPSRIDDSSVGNCEFHHINWLWPERYAEHYVLKYKVKPSHYFLKFVGWIQEK